MGGRGPLRLGLALALVLVVAQQTFADQQCRTGCRGVSHTFKYVPGTTYKYNYDGKIDITLSSAEGQASTTEVKAQVFLTQLPECNQILRLKNVQIISGGKKHGSIPHVEKPIRLNFHDGHVEDSICTEPGDQQNSINIKRAIASFFQANLKNGYETDIFGVCHTEVAQHHEGGELVIQKSRDLNRCNYRENLRQDFFATTFNKDSEIKSSPILNGDYSARLKIKNGILNQATITENYLYVPFSVGKNGAKAEVTSKLQFTGTSKENPKADVSVPKSIIFDNPHPVEAASSNVNTILNAVKEVAKTIDIVVGEKTAKEFVTLVKTVRAAKKDDLLAVYNQVKSGVGFNDKETGKKIFLDALLQAGVGETIEVAITLLKSHEFNGIEMELVYVGMSLVRHATLGSIKAATQLFNVRDLTREGVLGIGNLVGRYCKQHSCDNVDAVNQISQKLAAKLSSPKTTDKNVENQIIIALKGLANFGHLNDNIIPKITAIAQNKQASEKLRVVALEAYLSDPCKEKIRQSALTILQDIQQDSEVRIKAYLALAQCPNAKVGNAVKALLEKEPSYQVGGFISSHIRNIKASANPDKQLAKQFLGFSLTKKFPIDFRKWSYNNELSYSVDSLGVAASYETNIIYSQESPLFRSLGLNVTAEVFGQTFNFLELNTRLENLDKLVEHYFGPKGILEQTSLEELWLDKGYKYDQFYKNLKRKLEESLRTRRDVSRAEIENIGKAVQVKENILNKDVDIDISVKAFGSEIVYQNFNIRSTGLTPESVINDIVDGFNNGLDRLKNFQETYRTNMLFLDLELDYPTSLGFPLRLAAEGTANTQVKAEGGIDVRALLNKKDTTIKVKLIPSANIEVSGRLTLDALVVENGLKVVTSLHTATGGDATIGLTGQGQGLDVKFGLPVQIQKLISANHEIVFESREQAGPATISPLKFAQAKDFSICFDQLSPFIGLAFCADVNGPNVAGKQVPILPYPLAGDTKFSVRIENEDVKEYHVKYLNKNYVSGDLILEAIGKNGQKKVSIEFQSEISPQKYFKAVFSSPIKTAYAEGRITDTNQEKSLLLKAGQDNVEAYVKVGVGISGSTDRQIYSPILEYKTPDGLQQLPVHVDGRIIAEHNGPNRKYVFDNLKIHLPNQKVIGIVGNVGNDGHEIFTDLTVSEGQQSGSLRGRLLDEPHLIRLNVEVKNTINPNLNFILKGDAKSSPYSYESNWQLIHGQDLSSKTNIITISNSATRKYVNPNNFEVGFVHKFAYPLVGLNVNVEYGQTPKTVAYDLDFQYNDIKFGSELYLEVHKKNVGDFDVDFEIYGLDNKVEFKGSRAVLEDEKSKISNELTVNGNKLEVKGVITHKLKTSNVDIGADLTVVIPSHPTPFKVDSGLQYNPNELDVHHKVTSGNVVVIDLFLKANKNGNANGNVKVNIKNVLDVQGQLKAVKGKGTAQLQVDVATIKRQVRLESTFDVQPATLYNVVLTLYPNYGKDKNQKLILSTHTKLGQSSLESKNSVDLLGKVLEVNVQGSKAWTPENGKHNGEIEIIFPNNQYVLAKANGQYTGHGDVYNGDGHASLEYRKNKNNPGRKISLTGNYKNIDPEAGIYDVTYNVAADDAQGNNINSDLTFKVQKQGEKRVIDTSVKIHGSVIKNPISSNLKFSYSKGVGSYSVSSSYGKEVETTVGGKYDVRGGDNPLLGELELDLLIPNPNVKKIKSKVSGSVLIPKERTGEMKLQGGVSLYVDSNSSPNPLIDFNTEGQLRASDKDGELKGSLKVQKNDPVSVAVGYSRKEEGDKKQFNGNAALQYAAGKNLKIEGSLIRPNENNYKLELDIETPFDNFKKNKFTVDTKRADEGKHITSKIVGISDGSKWTLNTEYKSSEISPLFDFKLACPKWKKVELHLDGNRVSDREFGFNYRIWLENADFLLEGNLDANLADIENFSVKGQINSPKLDLDKISFEANNKPNKQGKRIQINIKSGPNNLVSGSTSYKAHEELGKFIIEGSGTLKIKNENKAANFKYISKQLTLEKNGEDGFEISFDAGVGEKAIDAELKVTNKQFRISDSYCEKKRECAHFEYDSKINENEVDKFNHVLEITVDLRKLGIPNEFGLKSVTTRKIWILDHTVDIHFKSPETSKYQYNLYLHPQEAGVSLTTPKRVIALESSYKGPKDIKQNGGKVSGEVAFYVDKKNQPNQKSALSGWLSSDPQGSGGLLNGEVKVVHPGLQRPLSISLRTTRSGELSNRQVSLTTTIDVFAQPQQKIDIEYKLTANADKERNHFSAHADATIKSSGLGINIAGSEQISIDRTTYSGEYTAKVHYNVGKTNYENVVSVKGSKAGSDVLVRLLNIDLLKLHNKYTLNKGVQTVESEISSYDNKPVVSHLEVKKGNTVLYTVGYKGSKGKLQFNAGLVPGQVADVRSDHITPSGKVNLFHASVKLDDANFLKPDFNVNSQEIEKVTTQVKEKLQEFRKGAQDIGRKLNNDISKESDQLSEITKNAAPNLGPAVQFYTNEWQKITQEINEDKALQSFGELLKTVITSVANLIYVVVEQLAKIAEALYEALEKVLGPLIKSVEELITTQLKRLTESVLFELTTEIIQIVLDIASSILVSVSQVIEKYQPEIQQLVAAFSELGKDVARFIQKSYEEVRKILNNIYKKIADELKDIPVFQELQAQWEDLVKNGLPNIDGLLGGLKEIAATLKDLVPPELPIQPEIVELIDMTVDYIEKRVKQQPVDDIAVFNKWTTIVANIAKKILNLFTSQTSDVRKPQVSVSFDFLKKLPKLVAVRFSPITYLLQEDVSKEVVAFGLSLLNNPRQWVPPFPLFAGIFQGQHIFTFDGKYLQFPASCKYLLARDAVNGNFTVIGTFANGKLNAITVADPHDSITVNENGRVTLNNAHVELPARKPDLAAYREYELVIIKSTAGVTVKCIPNLESCTFDVSGFYHAQVKGLLGKGNNEPYDDFTIPNGKIVATESEFGNSYKIGNCQPVVVPPAAPKNAKCEKLFGWESSLQLCYPFIEVDNYKAACAHGFASNLKDTELYISAAYVLACLKHNIPVSIPHDLVKCTNGDEVRSVGDKFSVKVPSNAADIVILVDTVKSNQPVYEELVKPLLPELTKGLAAKGIKDVEFHIIAYGGENQWPSHVTVGGKLTFKGKAPELKFSDDPKKAPGSRDIEALQSLLKDIQLALGQDLAAKTYTEGYDYPFRAQAAKSIIAVTSKPCEVGKLYARLRTLLFKDNQIALNLITPFEGLSIKDSKKIKDIVGFNKANVFTGAQAKKKPEGSAELYKDLQYNDYCVDFTVKNRGNVFVTENFLEGKPDFKKNFIHVASHNIVQEITSLEEGLDCKCRPISPYSARNICREAYSKEKAVPKKASGKA